MLNHSKHNNHSLLWKEIINGNEKAFHRLFEEQYGSLLLFGLRIRMNRELVKDMIQEVFLELWKKHDSLPHVDNLDAYLRQILKRKILKAIGKQTKTAKKISPSLENTSSYETLLIQQQTDIEVKKKLKNALQELTHKQKEIIQLRFYKGLSYDEIANQMGTQKRTVYNQVHSAILTLKKYMLILL